MRFTYGLILLLVGSVFVLGQDLAIEPTKPEFLIAKDVPIESLLGGYRMVVDLGNLPLNAKGVVKLNLVNRHQIKFLVNDLEIGCSCTSARIDVPAIEPNSSAMLTVELATPPGSKRQSVTNTVTLVSKADRTKNITIGLQYALSGLMSFTGTSYIHEIDSNLDRHTIMAPLLITEPVVTNNVRFEVTPDSPGVVVSLVEEQGLRFAKIEFDPVFVSDDGLHLSVVARDDASDATDTLPLLLCKREHLQVTPRTLRLRNEGEQIETECLLRYRAPLVEEKPDLEPSDQQDSAISVEASLGDVKLKVRTKRLGIGIYRVYLSGATSKLQDCLSQEKKVKLRWHVVTPEKAYSVESLWFLDSFVTVPESEER